MPTEAPRQNRRLLLFSIAPIASLLALMLALSAPSAGPTFAQDAAATAEPAATEAAAALSQRPAPRPESEIAGQQATLSLFFRALNQGRVGLIRASLNSQPASAIYDVSGSFLGRPVPFFRADDGFYALLAPGMEQPTSRANPLSVTVTTTGDVMETLTAEVEIVLGEFIRQQVTLPPATAGLIDPALERTEIVQLQALFNGATTEKAWDEQGFMAPVPAALTSPFGAFRTFNETFNTRHTGWDFQVGLGAPVLASAAGRVVFASELPIRGAHVIIDHGLNVYSGYSHLATRHVTRGQAVERGQVLGTVGRTGRVSGPHFHWEMAVGGDFIDGAEFIAMWLP